MPAPPPWWDLLTEYAAARYHPGGALIILREVGRIVINDPTVTPHRLRRDAGAPISPSTERVVTAFFVSHGMTLPQDPAAARAADTRDGYLNAIAAPLYQAVAQYNQAQIAEQNRRARTGLRVLSSITTSTRLRILRDLAAHLCADRSITGWAEVTTTDLENFLTPTPTARHQRTYVLRRYFAWAKAHKHVLVDPARPLRLGAQRAFTGPVLEVNTQRTLFRRWTDQATPAQERLVGLLALLHAASNAEIRMLTLADLDPDRQTVTLHRRPYPTTMDPATWAAVQACRQEHAATGTLNPHLIVSRVTRSRDTPVHASYIVRLLQPARITPSTCRQTRLTQLVGDLDPKLAATVLGMQDTGLLRYLADNVDQDRLHHNTSGTIDPTRAL